jgi:UDP:flavonoid glycosyltransferase YjiC (YdhE family)
VIVASVGWTGHLYPALALARELRERGNDVLVESFEGRRELVEGLGLGFQAATERISFPGVAEEDAPSLADAARGVELDVDGAPADVVVSDLFTLAPALAAEVAGARRATLVPHPYPVLEGALPYYPLGLQPARTGPGRAVWRGLRPLVGPRLPNTRLRRVRASIDASRAELGLPPLTAYDGQISEELAIVATFPQLEYPRDWPSHVHVTGPLPFELPHPEIELPGGDDPLVLVAPSTERDPEQDLIRVTLEALADEPVAVLATTNRPGAGWDGPVPANATVVDWLAYSQAMPRAALVVTHGGHGTLTRALAAGTPALVSPPAGDMAENGARLTWSGAGLAIPNRLLAPGPVRWSVRRLLADGAYAARAGEIASWARANDAAAAAAELIEGLAP